MARELRAGPSERRAVSTTVNSVRNEDPDILVAMSRQALFDLEGGNVLDNASASNSLDREKGNRRQPHFRLSGVARIS